MRLETDTVDVPGARPATAMAVAILNTAEQAECNLIGMASHGRHSVKRLLLGGQAAEAAPAVLFSS